MPTLLAMLLTVSQIAGDHWSFRPIERPALPAVKDAARARNAVDPFVLARLERAGLDLAPPASRETLIRRLSLDLLGLPPSPEEIDAFLADTAPDAVERLVDRLLASPHFGERWGRHWLDLARYADSNGYEDDRSRPDAWRYRDWVVDAVNADQPFDRFTVEQIAGDLIPDATYSQRVATGFHRMCPSNEAGNPAVAEEYRVRTAKDRANTVGAVWLGLTVACAQCHEHKYDPVSQEEYYRLFAFFNGAVDVQIDAPPLPREYQEAYERAREAFSGTDNNAPLPPSTKALTIADPPEPPPTHVHVRGDFLEQGPEVAAGTPAFLPELSARGSRADRLDLARWIAAPANPLTRRVAANHVWQHLFGRGIVKTSEDLGTQGSPPTHPKLLDLLADELLESGWSRKRLARLIVTSATYRQSSRKRPRADATDPENRLLHRQNRLRVEAEIVRDLALAASGLLVWRLGGPSVQPRLPAGLADMEVLRNERFRDEDEGSDLYRRGLYTNVQRTFLFPAFETFDVADPNVSCSRRHQSTTPIQALTLLNERGFFECARALGHRMARRPDADPSRVIRETFRRCLGRWPDDDETHVLGSLFEELRALYRGELVAAQAVSGDRSADAAEVADLAAWIGVARTILNLEEFITRE